jgi:glycosyltransferase involved in cell wall biosynthesis
VVVQNVSELFWPGDETLDEYATVYGAADAVWFVSEANRRLTEHQSGVRLPNSRIVRNPFRVSHDAAPVWPTADDGWRLACPARLEAIHKGQDLLIRVLAAPKWQARDLSVTLFGAGGQERYLRRLAGHYGVGDKVRFGGVASDIAQVWATHHGFVLASRCEGLPLALVEAMLCGRMAVVTDVGGNAELVTDGESGFIAQAVTAGGIDDALERAWHRRNEWQVIGRHARETVSSIVPSDPVGVFVDEIRQLIAGH